MSLSCMMSTNKKSLYLYFEYSRPIKKYANFTKIDYYTYIHFFAELANILDPNLLPYNCSYYKSRTSVH